MCISGRWLQRGHSVTSNGLPTGRVPRVFGRSVSLFGQHRRHGSAGSTATTPHQSPAVLRRSERGVRQGVWRGAVPAADRTAAAAATPVEPTPSIRTTVTSCRPSRDAHAQPGTTSGRVRSSERRLRVQLPRGTRPRSRRSTDAACWRDLIQHAAVVDGGWREPSPTERQFTSDWCLVPDHAFISAVCGRRVTVRRPPRCTVSWSCCCCWNELDADVVTERTSLRVRRSHVRPGRQTVPTMGCWTCLLAVARRLLAFVLLLVNFLVLLIFFFGQAVKPATHHSSPDGAHGVRYRRFGVETHRWCEIFVFSAVILVGVIPSLIMNAFELGAVTSSNVSPRNKFMENLENLE